MTNKHPPQSILLPIIIRFSAYIIGIILITTATYYDAHRTTNSFAETSLVENIQLIILLLATLTSLHAWRTPNPYRHPALLLATFTTVSLIRECDHFLDRHTFHGSWILLVTLTLALSFTHLWRHRQSLTTGLTHYLPTASSGLFMGGFLTTYVFSRLFGSKHLWKTALQDDYLKIAKTIAEESTELLGYTLILYATIEIATLARQSLHPNK